MDKIKKLAKILLDYSIRVQKNDFVVLEASIESKPLIQEIYKYANKKGVFIYLILNDDDFSKNIISNAINNDDHLDFISTNKKELFQKMDGYISIRATKNDFSREGILTQDLLNYDSTFNSALKTRLEKKWVVLRWPTHSFAQNAQMNYDDYFDFCFNAMVNDYETLNAKLKPLKNLMDKTNQVKIVGPGTNIEFSIKGINSVICSGRRNIPDGEVYSAPVRDSVNGTILYNTMSIESGIKWNNVKLTFKNGKIISATSKNNLDDELIKIFTQDEGASYIGEFSLGVNNEITNPIGDILYDEKIGGSFHLTPGSCYTKASNGNKSALHWDLVCIQNQEYGGGEIFFDDVLIRKDGKFVIKELLSLNK